MWVGGGDGSVDDGVGGDGGCDDDGVVVMIL